jgi:hypothetical protein
MCLKAELDYDKAMADLQILNKMYKKQEVNLKKKI